MNAIFAIARKEFCDDSRNRWTIAIAMLFAVLSLGIAYFGGAASGKVGFTSFAVTLASLTTLAAFIVPLIGLLIGYDMIVGERDGGTLLLMLSYPISRAQFIAGKFAGHCGALMMAILMGFGVAVAVMQIMQPESRTWAAWLRIGNFTLSASMLGASFIGLAGIISAAVKEKTRASGLALLLWLATVVLFDLILLAVLIASRGNHAEQMIFPYLLLLDPIDVFRLINLTLLGDGAGNELFVGMTGAHVYSPPLLYGALLLWCVLPLGVALLLFRQQEM